MTTNRKAAPSPAEEQLAPAEQAMQAIADIEALLRDATWPNITEQNRIICAKQALDVYVPIARAAALRSNREKDAQLANFEDVLESMKELDKSRNPCGHLACYGFTDNGGKTGFCTLCELAEKDAKIAELTEDVRLAKYERNQYDAAHKREVVNVLKLSAQLRAVSEALKEKLETQRATHEATLASIPFYWASEVDARDARLRSIVDGKGER